MSVRAVAPGGVGNLGVGFDLLGHSLAAVGDAVIAERDDRPGVRILAIDGEVAGVDRIPFAIERNTAGRGVAALLAQTRPDFGIALRIRKGIPIGAGLGGSASSCVAALVAANALLPQPLPREALYPLAIEGESASTGARHGDNVAPMLLGGLTVATLDRALRLPVPDWLHAAVVHPDQVLETRQARAVLADPYPLADVVTQTGHLAWLLTGLARGDRAMLRAGLRDVLVEPRRAPLVPGFAAVKQAALDHGAFGASLSGAGPSVFAWFDGASAAHAGGAAMQRAFAAAGFASRLHVCAVDGPRAEVTVEAPAEHAP